MGDIVYISGRISKFHDQIQVDCWSVRLTTIEQEYLFKLKVCEMDRIYKLKIQTECLDNRDLTALKHNRKAVAQEKPGVVDTLEAELSKLLILEFTNPTEFDSVCHSDLLKERYQQLSGNPSSDPNFRQILAKTTQRLVNQGKIFQHPPESNIYTQINCKNLGVDICRILRSETLNGGLYFDELMILLKKESRYVKVEKNVVSDMVGLLSSQGQVSEIQPQKYISY